MLEFAARRLEGRPVGFLLSLRTPSSDPAPLGLDRALGDGRARAHPRRPAERRRAASADQGSGSGARSAGPAAADPPRDGRQSVLRARARSSLLHAGAPAAGEALPVPDDVRELVAARLRTLPGRRASCCSRRGDAESDGRRACGARSARRRSRSLARLAARRGGDGVSSSRASRSASSIRSSRRRSSAAALAATSGVQAHRRLAALAANPEERARHLALCTEEPDGAVASTVADAAREARRRGAPEAAVELAELAIRLTPRGACDEHDRRALELGYYLVEAGDADVRVSVLLAVARTTGAAASHERCSTSRGSTTGARAACPRSRAASRPSRRQRATPRSRRPVMRSSRSTATSTPPAASGMRRAALELLDAEAKPPTRTCSSMRCSRRRGRVCSLGAGCRPTRRARVRIRGASGDEVSTLACRRAARPVAQVRRRLRRLAREARGSVVARRVAEGDESSMPNVLMHLAQLECWSGNWPLAARYAEESFELAEQRRPELRRPAGDARTGRRAPRRRRAWPA